MYRVDIDNKTLVPLTPTNLSALKLHERYDLQEWIEKTPAILDEDLLIICKELELSSGARMDLLAIDRNARLVVVELKRDDSGRNVDWQAIRYASYVSNFTHREIYQHYADYLDAEESDAADRIAEFVGDAIDNLNESQRIILCARDFHSDVASSVLWLRDYGLDITCIRIQPYVDTQGAMFLNTEIIIPLPEARDYIQRKERKEKEKKEQGGWSSFKYVQVGEGIGKHRNWDDCVRYGFLSAGQDHTSSKKLRTLDVGDRIFAYMSGLDYVGYGEVTAQPVSILQFHPLGDRKSLLDLPLNAALAGENSDNEKTEYAVAIKWYKTFSRTEAKTFSGIYTNPGIVTRIREGDTIKFLKKEFEVDTFEETD